jgi:hypothetical protein
MRMVGTAGASAAGKPARGTPRPERSAVALAPSFGAHCERGLVVHRTINEGPALGRARGTHLDSLNRIGAAAYENQNKTNVVSSRGQSPESGPREHDEMPAKFLAGRPHTGGDTATGVVWGALMKKRPSNCERKTLSARYNSGMETVLRERRRFFERPEGAATDAANTPSRSPRAS